MSVPSPKLPGIRRRLASALYDSVLLIGVVAVAWLLPQTLIGMLFNLEALPAVSLAHFVLVIAAYFIWQWRNGGQTLAMKTWKIRLQSVAGGPISWRQLLIRFVLACLGLGFGGAGFLWALFDRDRQFLHDRFAGTRIVFKT